MPWESALPADAAGALAEPHTKAALTEGEAFAGFHERSARPLWAYLARVSGDPSLADDLVQESYLRFLTSGRMALLATEGEVAARRYLFRIGSNLLHDHWRRPRTEPVADAPEELFATHGATLAAESRMMLGPAFRQLRPRDRQLLWLAYAEGYSHREIAEATGLASASVRLLLYRSRRRVLKLLNTSAAAHGTQGVQA